MKFRTGMLVGLGVGYVLGAKAGRERYEQILEATRAFMENPGVQRLTDEVGKTVNLGKDRVSNVANRKVEQFGDKGTASEKTASSKTSTAEGTSTSGAPPATATRGGRDS